MTTAMTDNETDSIELLDFREITAGSMECQVKLRDGFARAKPWIKCHSLSIRSPTSYRNLWWDAEARLDSVYDPEHDLCKAFTLPLLGVTFKGAYWGRILFAAAVDPTRPDDFLVPAADYNPGKTHGKPCEQCEGDAHLMVPEGFYVPDHDPELFSKVVGAQVEISLFVREPGP